MKVLFLIDTLAVGGSERSLLEVARGLREFEPVICYVYPGEALRPEFEAAGVEVLSIGLAGRYAFREGVRAVRRVIRATEPDLIHTTLFRSDVIGRLAGRLEGVPIVSGFINDSYHPRRWGALTALGKCKLAGVLLIDRLSARLADGFVAVSAPTARSNARALGIPVDRVRVIHRGRDPERYVPHPDARAQTRTALGIAPNTPVALNVARLLARKGHEDLIRAVARLGPHHPDLVVLLAGDGHDRARFEELADSLGSEGRVRFLGRRDDVPDLLAAADVFVFPSHFEGHPGALVEAMMAGCPIVASDLAINREMLGDDERGRLFAVGDPQALADVLEQVLSQPEAARSLGRRARDWAAERFTTGRMVEGHEALYRDVLAERR